MDLLHGHHPHCRLPLRPSHPGRMGFTELLQCQAEVRVIILADKRITSYSNAQNCFGEHLQHVCASREYRICKSEVYFHITQKLKFIIHAVQHISEGRQATL